MKVKKEAVLKKEFIYNLELTHEELGTLVDAMSDLVASLPNPGANGELEIHALLCRAYKND